eukprot:TRINITY_DN1313_c0_g2_i2.p1 TRINITY_DN1313_c0_g2~~TRINITY_DN1313_c0_g2_i2.p1  ORF type:complete len:140 (+),score=7.00 TRINITY_DN1313_c0_g2_i2:134-553(+)
MTRIKFSIWGQNLAATGAYFTLHGGVIDFFYEDSDPLGIYFPVAIYSVAVGFILFLFFYPFKYLGPILIIVNFNFIPVAIVLAILSVFPCFMLPTMIGGVTLFVSAIFFLVAGILREKGATVKELLCAWTGKQPPRRGE